LKRKNEQIYVKKLDHESWSCGESETEFINPFNDLDTDEKLIRI